MSNQSPTAIAQQLGVGSNVVDWIIERFGPVLSELLLELLLRKSTQGVTGGPPPVAQPEGTPGVVVNEASLLGSIDLRSIILILLERYGQALLERAAGLLESRDDLPSKLLSSVLRDHSASILKFIIDLLDSPDGAKLINEAVASVLAKSE